MQSSLGRARSSKTASLARERPSLGLQAHLKECCKRDPSVMQFCTRYGRIPEGVAEFALILSSCQRKRGTQARKQKPTRAFKGSPLALLRWSHTAEAVCPKSAGNVATWLQPALSRPLCSGQAARCPMTYVICLPPFRFSAPTFRSGRFVRGSSDAGGRRTGRAPAQGRRG